MRRPLDSSISKFKLRIFGSPVGLVVKALVRESLGPRFETTFGHFLKLEKILSPADASEALVACIPRIRRHFVSINNFDSANVFMLTLRFNL